MNYFIAYDPEEDDCFAMWGHGHTKAEAILDASERFNAEMDFSVDMPSFVAVRSTKEVYDLLDEYGVFAGDYKKVYWAEIDNDVARIVEVSPLEIPDDNETDFMNGFTGLSKDVYNTAKDRGWWECPAADTIEEAIGKHHIKSPKLQELADKLREANDGEAIALMHSELSEGLEAVRKGNPPDSHIPEFSGLEAELADVIIRIMNFSHSRNLRVAEAVIAKMKYNKTRTYKHGNKKF